MQPESPQVDAIDALLPQLQCQRCGYAGCRPYAVAVVAGEAGIDRCPPGGQVTLEALAELLGCLLPAKITGAAWEGQQRYVIDAARCIGCTKCLNVCPTDAIVGAPHLMHDIIAASCTGCGLCVPPCPVDCIQASPRSEPVEQERAHWRQSFKRRHLRHERAALQGPALLDVPQSEELIQAEIEAAVRRVRARQPPR